MPQPYRKRRYDRDRAGKPGRNWYKLKAWTLSRMAQLTKQPWCERCLNRNVETPATVVNHRKAHKGDWKLFIDPDNHESVCEHCHNSEIQSEEMNGFTKELGADGWPIDPNHPANKEF